MRETSVSRPLGVSSALGYWGMGVLLCRKRRQLAACGNPPCLSLPGCKQCLGVKRLEVADVIAGAVVTSAVAAVSDDEESKVSEGCGHLSDDDPGYPICGSCGSGMTEFGGRWRYCMP